jgi:hypothetical protein
MTEPRPEPLPLTPQGQKALASAIAELRANRPGEAARLLGQAVLDAALPNDQALAGRLLKAAGREGLEHLVEAFVHFPCFYCKKGRDRCSACHGSGRPLGGAICEACIGMGLERCDFCDGSGWVTINYVPRALQPPVLRKRALLAFERLRKLLEQPAPRAVPGQPAAAIKQCYVQLLEIDRQLGVVENCFTARQSLVRAGQNVAEQLDRVLTKCVSLVGEAESRLREIVAAMASAHQIAAQAPGTSGTKRQADEQVAAFWAAYTKPERSAIGVLLKHPFLSRALRKRSSQEAGKQNSGGSPPRPSELPARGTIDEEKPVAPPTPRPTRNGPKGTNAANGR